MKKILTTFSLFLVCVLAFGMESQPITEVKFVSQLPDGGNLVLGVYEQETLGQYGTELDAKVNGALTQTIRITGFDAKPLTTKLITGLQGTGYDQILLVGLGRQGEVKQEVDWQNLGGNAYQAGVEAFKIVPALAFDVPAEAAAQMAFGAKLSSYYFGKYLTTKEHQPAQAEVTIVSGDALSSSSFYQNELDPVANAMWLTRDISNEPANVIYPESFVQRWRTHFKGMDNISIRVFDEKEMLKKGMGAIYGVGRGSARPPRMMIVEYMAGEKDQAPVVIAGKGITFDSGGISIKVWEGMWDMKFDMSGAAGAVGTVYALAGRKAKVNVVAVAALAENMPDGNAQRPADIVKSLSGKTIEVLQTDAEGRLVLADGLYFADTTYNPALIVDIATLTGSTMRTLDGDYAALFTRHEELVEPFLAMGKQTGDELWHMPLNDNHRKAMDSNVADISNMSLGNAGASTAAAFLSEFVRESTPWVHLDIAGVEASAKATPVKRSPGSTAFAIRLMNGYIKKHFE